MNPALIDSPRRFSPRRVRGCALYLDARRIPAGSVASTPNLGTLVSTLSQGTANARPTAVASGFGSKSLPYLAFDGGDYLSDSTQNLVSAGGAMTVVAICQHDAAAGGGLLQARLSSKYLSALTLVAAGVSYMSGNGVDAPQNCVLQAGSLSGITSPHVARWTFRGTGQAPQFAINGVAKTVTAGTQGTENGSTGFHVGASVTAGPTQFLTGKLCAIAVFSRELSAGEAAYIDAWGASLI